MATYDENGMPDPSTMTDEELERARQYYQNGPQAQPAPAYEDITKVPTAELERRLQGYKQQTAQQPINLGADIAKGAGTGLVEGAAAIPGVAGDIQSLAQRGVKALGGTPPPTPGAAPLPSAVASYARALGATPASPVHAGQLPTSEQTVGATERNVTGPLYQPQSVLGKTARSMAQYAPSVAGGGLEGLPGALGSRAFYGAMLPGAASEAAGAGAQWVGAPNLEPYARLMAGAAAGPSIVKSHNPISPEMQTALDVARNATTGDLTRNLTPGQRAGNPKASLGGTPTPEMTRNLFGDWTREFLSGMGLNSATWKDRGGNSLIAQRMNELGNEVNGIASRNVFTADQAGINALTSRMQRYRQLVTDPKIRENVENHYNGAIDKLSQNNWQMPGRELTQLSSDWADSARHEPQPASERALYDMREIMHDMYERSMQRSNSPDAGQYANIRNQQRIGIIMKRAADANDSDVQKGFLPPDNVLNAIKAEGDRGSVSNLRGNLPRIASSGVALKVGQPVAEPKSAWESFAEHLPFTLGLPAVDAAFQVAQHPGTFGLEHSLAAFGAGAVIPKALQTLGGTGIGRGFLGHQAFPDRRSMIPYYLSVLGQPAANSPQTTRNPP